MENNKLTPKQRAEIYLKVSRINNKINYGCYALEKAAKINRAGNNFSWMLENYFPEFNLFKPEKDTPSYQVWFKESEERLIAFLLSYQMALNATE